MFDTAKRFRFQDNELVILERTSCFRADLETHEDALLRLAAFARGWDKSHLDHMRRHFKIEPFYNASSMVLIFNNDVLIGTAGVDTSITPPFHHTHVLHLCSVNFHPSIQNTGLVALLFVLLADYVLADKAPEDQVYFSSISQSPLVYSLMTKLAPVYPDGIQEPPSDVVAVAQAVAAKYDPHLPLDPRTLTLRGECEFFYRKLPYVADDTINTLFDTILDVPRGDVFVNVARTTVKMALQRTGKYRTRFATQRMETNDA